MKRRAAAGIIRGPDFPPVGVNDGAADGKAKSHSLLFRRKETLEDLLHFFLRNAATAVGNANGKSTSASTSRSPIEKR